jgi:hypothetical protein
MTCNKMTEQWVPRGYHGSMRPIRCGNTTISGDRAICPDCQKDDNRMADIRRQERNIAADNAASHSAGWGDW